MKMRSLACCWFSHALQLVVSPFGGEPARARQQGISTKEGRRSRAYSFRWFITAESTVRWFIMREKHCWMAADLAE
jgi:hypothetical protein